MPKISRIMATLYMIERYETEYGIYNHDTPEASDNTLSVLLMHQAEQPIAFSLYKQRMRDYCRYDVQKIMGLSFDEFIARPRHELEVMLEVCHDMQAEEAATEADKLRRLELQQRK